MKYYACCYRSLAPNIRFESYFLVSDEGDKVTEIHGANLEEIVRSAKKRGFELVMGQIPQRVLSLVKERLVPSENIFPVEAQVMRFANEWVKRASQPK